MGNSFDRTPNNTCSNQAPAFNIHPYFLVAQIVDNGIRLSCSTTTSPKSENLNSDENSDGNAEKAEKLSANKQKYRFISIAQELVMAARGKLVERNWKHNDDSPATIDDISVFVIPIQPYKTGK